jgi:hypothetical protein
MPVHVGLAIIQPALSIPGPAPEAGGFARSIAADRSHGMAAADRHLLFGLLALQNGRIDQGARVAAFQARARDKALADHFVRAVMPAPAPAVMPSSPGTATSRRDWQTAWRHRSGSPGAG